MQSALAVAVFMLLLTIVATILSSPLIRHDSPEALPRSPVIGTDAPVQYEQRDDIGAPRRRLPDRKTGPPTRVEPESGNHA